MTISSVKSCLRFFNLRRFVGPRACSYFHSSTSSPFPRLLDESPELIAELQGEDTTLEEKLCRWTRNPLTEVKISSDRMLIYQHYTEEHFWLPLCFSGIGHENNQMLTVSPILNIFSISVHTNFADHHKPSPLVGSITANDGKGFIYNLYDGIGIGIGDDSQSISKDDHNNLVFGPGGGAITHFLHAPTTLNFSLTDTTRETEVIDGSLELPSESEHSFDKLLKLPIFGKNGHAYVYCTTFRFAVLALINVAIFESPRPFVDLHGTIIATYSNPTKYCSLDNDDVKYLKNTLFDRSSEKSARIEFGTVFPFSKYVVAVPVCSSLVIDIDLWDRDSNSQFVKCSTVFTLQDSGQLSKLIEIEGKGGGHIVVDVGWSNPYTNVLQRRRQRGYDEVTGKMRDKDYSIEPVPELDLYDNERFTSVQSPWGPTKTCSTGKGRSLMEVFSVYISGNNNRVSNLCGTINVRNDESGRRSFSLYERPESNPENLMPDRSIISIESHFAITSDNIDIEFDLKDADFGLEISRGRFCPDRHNWRFYDFDECFKWCNQNLCFVVKGAHGYAAVHYVVFDHAVQATLELTLCSGNCASHPNHVNVYGCVYARYSTYSCSTSYEKKYYQNRLFDKLQSESVQLTPSYEIPLLKSVVVVPSNSSLVIEADLRVNCVGNAAEAKICDIGTFEIDLSSDSVCKVIQGENYGIQVKVKFSHAYDL